MSAMSDYVETALLNWAFRGQAMPAPPVTVYLGLFTSPTTDSGGGTEVSGGSYARAAVSTTGGFTAPSVSAGANNTTNAASITWPVSSGAWGTVTHLGIFDAASGGNLLWHGALATPVAVGTGQQYYFNPNTLTLQAA